jgi:hypothetical protein
MAFHEGARTASGLPRGRTRYGTPLLSSVRAVKSRSPGILHLHGIWGASSRAAWLLARMEGDHPLVVSAHGMLEPWSMDRGRWKKRVAWRVWNGHLLRSAKCLWDRKLNFEAYQHFGSKH